MPISITRVYTRTGDKGETAEACPTGYVGETLDWKGVTYFVCRKES